MIRIFIGSPGTFKTVHALLQIVQAIEQGRSVYTNIEGLSWFGNDLTSSLGIFSNLHFLEPIKAQQFWRYVEPGSLAVIDEFDSRWIVEERSVTGWHFIEDHRHKFFECWFEEHYFSGTELILVGQGEQRFAEFFHHQPAACAVHKIVNPDRLHRFFQFDLLKHRFYGFHTGTVDSSYLFFQDRLEPAIDCRWVGRRLFLLDRTLNRISSFFGRARIIHESA